ncbi:MAG: hypothetical protein CVT70_16880 [Alphaproteobacteria bacterium HGW-Alphaproteobacteria-1]|jgi:hypothetical protein|nr:MAG: hypothetical protein CVT70_16880 [Alphaproteobacteria bacterium HGW-Alphaproteobacteria-1]
MKSFLPRRFRPNRQRFSAQIADTVAPPTLAETRTAFQNAVKTNFLALLEDKPPVALGSDVIAGLFPRSGDDEDALSDTMAPLAGDLVLRMMTTPDQLAVLAQPGAGFGAEILLPVILQDALMDGAFRHDMAETCRIFLCERVLFHPGAPPQALFSVAGMALLITSQEAHGQALGPLASRLRSAAKTLRSVVEPLNPWDQWLVRRMSAAASWVVAEDLASLPWVKWRHGDAPGEYPPETDMLPGSWDSILDLVP